MNNRESARRSSVALAVSRCADRSAPGKAARPDTSGPGTSPHEYPCTQCGGDAFIGYSASRKHGNWNGKIKIGERLCTPCFQKRGGERFL